LSSPLTSIASSSFPSLSEAPSEAQIQLQDEESPSQTDANESITNTALPTHRYSLRNRGTPDSRNARSRNVTPTQSVPATRMNENEGKDECSRPAPEHPYARRSTSAKFQAQAQAPGTLKRTHDEEGSGASLRGSPAVAAVEVIPPTTGAGEVNEGTSQRMTRSRARKVRKLDN